MKSRIISLSLFLIWFYSACVFAQAPVISYLIPDIGTPGMNTYVEIIGPNGQNGNFGTDSLYLNNPGDAVQVVCANASDSQYVRFGPCVVSWNGKMISTQAFVLPNASPNTWNWQSTNLRIPIQVLANGRLSNPDTFYIVQPQQIGLLNIPGALGSGGVYGLRSRRGAMIVDSLILEGNGNYTVNTQDCDPFTNGNQGYLPMVLISKGVITIGVNASLNISANGSDGGPGGGGSGAADVASPGTGFCAGGSDCSGLCYGTGSGSLGNSLNGCVSGGGNNFDQGGGGGTGHPFGSSGAMGLSGEASQKGGYGGGSAGGETGNSDNHVNEFGGGGGGYSSFGQNGQGTGIFLGNNSGFPVGNLMILPLAGGSGGGGGNQDAGGHGGSGGGGGGGLSLQAFTGCDVSLIRSDGSNGANGVIGNGLFPTSGAGGGGGAGGGLLIGGKLLLNSSSGFDVSGGSGGLAAADGLGTGQSSDGGNGGAGRVRIDGPTSSKPTVDPDSASSYIGPSTDTQSYVSRMFTLTGTGNGQSVRIYVRPLDSIWYLAATVSGYGTSWSKSITLYGTDSIYLLAAVQNVPSPSAAQYAADPPWLLSQAAANILHVLTCFPPIAAIASNKTPVLCAGDSVTLMASPEGFNYMWLKNGQSQAITSDSITVSDSGIYSVIVSSALGCSDSTSVSVVVNPRPIAVISGAQSLCTGSNSILTASPPGMNYIWEKNSQTLNDTTDTLMVSDSGIYSVSITNSSGCSDSTAVSVSVISAPVAGITGALSFCAGGRTLLVATPAGFNYKWMKNGQPLPATDTIMISDSGIYSVVVSNGGECSDSTSVSVSIVPSTMASITGPSSICQGSSGVLKASPTGLSYHWEKNGQQQPGTTDSLAVTDSGSYSVIVTNSSGCFDSTSVSVGVNPIPSASITGPQSFCSGAMGLLRASPVGLAYKWLRNGMLQSTTGDSLTVSDSGIYSVVVTNASGCSDSSSVSVTLDPSPVVSIAGTPSFCVGSGTVLKASPAGSVYEWEKNGQVQSVIADSLIVTDSGNYSVIVSNSNGCSDSATVLVIENSLPEVSITETDTITSTGTILIASKGASYLWSTGDTTQETTISKSDSIFVTVMDTNGCTSTSPVFYFSPICGEEQLIEVLQGKAIVISGIIPNPASSAFTVSFTNPNASLIRYEIDDVLGRILTSGETSESQLLLSASDLPEGVLLLRATSNGIVQTREFVVVK
jgi:hypothetical protein